MNGAVGAIGAVIDGYHRDAPQILAQDWPVFNRGGYAQDAGTRKTLADSTAPSRSARSPSTPAT